jgi:hypothetical protein
MSKFLLATTAMTAIASFTSAANAQLTVTLGGYTEFFAAIYDNNLPGGTEREFQLETEIVVKAHGKTDNGLLYGAKVELQNSVPTLSSTGVGTDEASVYVGGNWGPFDLGDEDGVADRMAIYAPLVGVEGIDGDYGDFVNVIVPAGNGTRTGLNLGRQPWGAPSTGAATKIGHVAPRFAGIQLGLSYAPENASEAQDVVSLKNDASLAALASLTVALAPRISALATSLCARRRSTSAVDTAERRSSSVARRNSTSANLCSASRIATSASALPVASKARRTAAFAASNWACTSVTSMRATMSPLCTASPSLTRISATRPASLVEISTRSTSILPLATARPAGSIAEN